LKPAQGLRACDRWIWPPVSRHAIIDRAVFISEQFHYLPGPQVFDFKLLAILAFSSRMIGYV
jgi:hypothetical protein